MVVSSVRLQNDPLCVEWDVETLQNWVTKLLYCVLVWCSLDLDKWINAPASDSSDDEVSSTSIFAPSTDRDRAAAGFVMSSLFSVRKTSNMVSMCPWKSSEVLKIPGVFLNFIFSLVLWKFFWNSYCEVLASVVASRHVSPSRAFVCSSVHLSVSNFLWKLLISSLWKFYQRFMFGQGSFRKIIPLTVGWLRHCSRSQSPQCVRCWIVCAWPLLITLVCMCLIGKALCPFSGSKLHAWGPVSRNACRPWLRHRHTQWRHFYSSRLRIQHGGDSLSFK